MALGEPQRETMVKQACMKPDCGANLQRFAQVADVAQLVERQVVVLDVVGSSPIVRPSFLVFQP
jgi:hypothetical protein